MKTQALKMKKCERIPHRALECGGVVATPSSPQTSGGAGWRRGVAATLWPRAARLAFGLLPFAFCLGALAQDYAIDWHKIAGGGGTSSGGNYAVSGTPGQPDASVQTMSGGNYSLTGGFWSLISVVQTAGAPTLYISHSGNTVTVYWQAVSGWNLQQNINLSSPSGWSASSGVTTANGTNGITITSPTGNLFFQLKSNP